jgi:hypothetical protein
MGKDHLGGLSVDRRIILKWVLKLGLRVQRGLISFKKCTSGDELLQTQSPLPFHKIWEYFLTS